MLYFKHASLSSTKNKIDSGEGGIEGVLTELYDLKLLVKARVLDKCVNYFCLLLLKVMLLPFTMHTIPFSDRSNLLVHNRVNLLTRLS